MVRVDHRARYRMVKERHRLAPKGATTVAGDPFDTSASMAARPDRFGVTHPFRMMAGMDTGTVR